MGKQQRHDVSLYPGGVQTRLLLTLFSYSEYIKKDLAQFAEKHPQIEIVVQPRPAHHPVVRGYYCKLENRR